MRGRITEQGKQGARGEKESAKNRIKSCENEILWHDAHCGDGEWNMEIAKRTRIRNDHEIY